MSDIFYSNDGHYIQIMVLSEETGGEWSYWHYIGRHGEIAENLERAKVHYRKLCEDKARFDYVWLYVIKQDMETTESSAIPEHIVRENQLKQASIAHIFSR